jgi:multiple sugar transport system substrate-binding protein
MKATQHPTRRRLLAATGCLLSLSHTTALRAAASPVTLTVAAFPALDEIVKAALPRFKELQPEINVKVVSRQFIDHHAAMTTALSTSSQLPDVMALEVGYVGRFAQGGGLEDLSAAPYEAQRHRAAWVPYAVDQGSDGGRIVAVPGDIGPGTLLYRADTLQRAGLKESDLTASWDTYVEAGRQLKSRANAYLVAHARDLKDIVIRTGLAGGEGLYFDRDSRVLVDSPRFARAFELAQQVRKAGLDARVNAWSNEWTTAFRRGTLATQMSGAWLAGHLSNWLAPDTRGLWRAAPLPGGVTAAYGGSFLAIPRRADPARKAAAWELIRLLTLDRSRQLAAFKAQDAFPALVSAHDDPFFAEPLPFLGGQAARQLWRDAARRITAVPVHRQDAFAEEVVNTELDKVLDQGKAVAAALADARRQLERRARR